MILDDHRFVRVGGLTCSPVERTALTIVRASAMMFHVAFLKHLRYDSRPLENLTLEGESFYEHRISRYFKYDRFGVSR